MDELGPRFSPTERRLDVGPYAGVTVTVTEDAAGCALVELLLDKVSTPPLRVTLGGLELYSSMPEPEAWAAAAEAKAPEVAEEDAKRALEPAVVASLPAEAKTPEIIEAAVEAAYQASANPPASPV